MAIFSLSIFLSLLAHHDEWGGTSSEGSSWDSPAGSLPSKTGMPANMSAQASRSAIPLEWQAGQPSQGASFHDSGTCRPCLFVHTAVGCNNGAACTFCHLQHARGSKPRPCKGKRDRYKKNVARMREGSAVADKAYGGVRDIPVEMRATGGTPTQQAARETNGCGDQ